MSIKSRRSKKLDKKEGLILAEIVITAIIAGIVVAVAVSTVKGCSGKSDWKRAKIEAEAFSKGIPGATGQVSCKKKDTDGDGYCRCTVFRKDKLPITLDCGCERFCIDCAEGCSIIQTIKTNQKSVHTR